MRTGYVDLRRTFLDVPGDQEREEAALASYLHHWHGTVAWDELLESRVVVILAEAGSGKTWEIEARAEAADLPSRPAFVVPLHALATAQLSASLSADDAGRFAKWQSGRSEALFFLDSVDESRISSREGFRDALRNLEHGLGRRRRGAWVVITSRVSEWRYAADAELVARTFSVSRPWDRPDGHAPLGGALRVVRLAPLSREQVKILARDTLGQDCVEFILALDHAHAWDFVRRPLDAKAVAEYWRQERHIGSLSEVLAADVGRKLEGREARDEPGALSPERARLGAERLAAASILCGRVTFAVPDEDAPAVVLANSLRPQDVLADWTAADIRTLLGRPLFDPAAFGRVRFHHRTAADFLAAQWLGRRVTEGCPQRALEGVLVRTVHGHPVLVPSRAAMAAWLCDGRKNELWRERLRRKLIDIAPAALMQHGDPWTLPVPSKRAMLNACIARCDCGQRFRIDAEQVAGLADLAIASGLAAILCRDDASTEGRILALRVIWHGKLAGADEALDAAIRIACGDGEDRDLRMTALHTVASAGSREQVRRFAADLVGSCMPMTMAADAVRLLFPEPFSTADLIRVIGRQPSVPEFGGPGLPDALVDAVARAPAEDVASLVHGMIDLVGPTPPVYGTPADQVPFAWLAQALPAALLRLLRRDTLGPKEINLAARAYDIIGPLHHVWHPDRLDKRELQLASERHPTLRRAMLMQRSGATDSSHIFRWDDIVGWCQADLEHFGREISAETDIGRKTILLQQAASGWFSTGRDGATRRLLLQAATRHEPQVPGARGMLPRRANFGLDRLRIEIQKEKRWRLAARWQRVRCTARRARTSWQLLCLHRRMAGGEAPVALAHLAFHRMEHGHAQVPTSSHPSSDHWDPLGLIDTAARAGWKARWRRCRVRLPGEREDTSIENDLLIGLAGFAADLQDGLAISDLTAADALTAARLAARAINGPPGWLHGLAEACPGAVRETVSACLALEWRMPEGKVRGLGVTDWLHGMGPAFRRMIVPDCMRMLSGGDPLHPDILRHALELLLSTPDGLRGVGELAPARTHARPTASAFHRHWLAAWLHVGGGGAVDYLERMSGRDPTAADQVVAALAEDLRGWRRREGEPDVRPAFEAASELARLISLLHRHVRPREDLLHEPGVIHQVTPRDHVQHLRDAMLANLAQMPEPCVYGRLVALLSDPAMGERIEWLNHLVRERRERESEVAWQAGDLIGFETAHETAPRTASALFEIALARIDDLKGLVEHDDFSPRRELDGTEPEADLQIWTARKLREASRQRYDCQRETETDLRRQPDVRLTAPGIPAISIEMKWAQDWSYNQLLSALLDQLVRLYLRGARLRNGIMVLANGLKSRTGRPRRSWIGHDQTAMEFAEMVAALNLEARSVLDGAGDIDGLMVTGIDFTVPE